MYARPFMNQIIHVTGAASGIGRAAALAFVKKGHLSLTNPTASRGGCVETHNPIGST